MRRTRQTDRQTVKIIGRRYTLEQTDIQTQTNTDFCRIRLPHIVPCVLGSETAAAKTGFSSGRVFSTPPYWAFGTPLDWVIECEQEMGGYAIYSAVHQGWSKRQAKVIEKRVVTCHQLWVTRTVNHRARGQQGEHREGSCGSTER